MNTSNKINAFLAVFLGLILVLVASPINAQAAGVPTLGDQTANVTGSRNAILSIMINPNGSPTEVHFRYWAGSVSKETVYLGANGTSSTRIEVGLFNLAENTNYSYQIYAKNSFGSNTGSVGSFTTTGSGGTGSSNTTTNNNSSTNTNNTNNNTSGSSTGTPLAPSVSTNGPASISSSSVIVNGSVNPNNASTNFWFEFGLNQSLSQKTSVQSLGSGSSWQLVTGNISNLESGKTYYYRVVAQNSQGISYGDVRGFNTGDSTSSGQSNGQVLGAVSGSGTGSSTGTGTNSSSTTSKTSSSGTAKTTTNGTSGSTSTTNSTSNPRPSFISLEYSLDNSGALVVVADDTKPAPGDKFDYTVVYKNDTSARFNEANIRIIIPVEAEFINSSIEPLKISGNVVEFKLGNIEPRDRGAITVSVQIREIAKPGTELVFTSVLGYKDALGVQLATTSYLTVTIGEGENTALSASIGALFGGFGTALLIIAILIVIFLLLYYKFSRGLKKAKEEELRRKQLEENKKNIFEKVPATFEPIDGINISYE